MALKVISLRGMRSWKTLELFERECGALRSLSHPGIPELVDSLEVDVGDDRVYVLVQRKARGASLEELIAGGFRFSTEQVQAVFERLLEVLEYLGSRSPVVLHRDVKPANVIVDIGGSGEMSVALVDFGAVGGGIPGGTMVGTFGYMPPEAFGGSGDVRSDLYGVGATMFFAISGKAPGDVVKTRLKMDVGSVVDEGKRRELGNVFTVMTRLLEPAPEDRYRSAGVALKALREKVGMRMERSVREARRETFSGFNFGDDDDDEDEDDPYNSFGRSSGLQGSGGLVSRAKQYMPGGGVSAKMLRQPAGSRVVIEKDDDGRLLRVFIPPKGFTMQTASSGAFALTWTGFVGFWTAGVVTGGGPLVLGLFSLPFWYAGVKMGKRVVDDIRMTTELVLSAGGGEKEVYFFSLKVAGALGDVREAEGDARDLDGASVDVVMYQNGRPVTEMALREGTRRHVLGEDLDDVEQDWLCSEINSFLKVKPQQRRLH